jgi:hypothetical protein
MIFEGRVARVWLTLSAIKRQAAISLSLRPMYNAPIPERDEVAWLNELHRPPRAGAR